MVSSKQLIGIGKNMSRNFVLYSRNKKDFELRKRAADNDAIVIGGYSSTIGNAHDLLQQNYDEAIVITNTYHVPRVKLVMDHYGVHGKVIAAEKILGLVSRQSLTEPLKMFLTVIFVKVQNLVYGSRQY